MMQFRVLGGRHVGRKPLLDENGKPKRDRHGDVIEKTTVYGHNCAAGDVFEEEMDMTRLNVPGYPPKFALVGRDEPESEEELLRRIEADQRKLNALRGIPNPPASTAPSTAPNPAPPFIAPSAGKPSVPGKVEEKPNPHVAPPAETEAVRRQRLNQMPLKQLQDIAASEEIDVANCKTKEDVIKAILGK